MLLVLGIRSEFLLYPRHSGYDVRRLWVVRQSPCLGFSKQVLAYLGGRGSNCIGLFLVLLRLPGGSGVTATPHGPGWYCQW